MKYNNTIKNDIPIILSGIMTFCCVCATSIKVNVDAAASTSQIVRLVPSTHTKPFGTIYFMLDEGTWIWNTMGGKLMF